MTKMSFTAQKPQPEQPQPKAQRQNVEQPVRRRLTTVALIGPDGCGKSAVAKALLESSSLPLKYLYMGVNIESSNVALPTSRLIHKWKVYQHKKSLQRLGKEVPATVSLHGVEHRVDKRGRLGGVGRLLRRVSEEVYRQLVSWLYQIRGNVVLYDRHFLFDALPIPADTTRRRFTETAHHWFLKTLYPRPGLAILLDAPPEVMYARKQEVPVEYLERDRMNLLQKRCYAQLFISVDATKPLEEVVSTVHGLIHEHCAN